MRIAWRAALLLPLPLTRAARLDSPSAFTQSRVHNRRGRRRAPGVSPSEREGRGRLERARGPRPLPARLDPDARSFPSPPLALSQACVSDQLYTVEEGGDEGCPASVQVRGKEERADEGEGQRGWWKLEGRNKARVLAKGALERTLKKGARDVSWGCNTPYGAHGPMCMMRTFKKGWEDLMWPMAHALGAAWQPPMRLGMRGGGKA